MGVVSVVTFVETVPARGGAVPRPAPVAMAEPEKVQMALGDKEMQHVYLPIQLFGRRAIAMLDTGCDTSITGERMLPVNANVQPTMHALAANGTPIPLEGEYKVHFTFGGKEFSVYAVVTKSVHEFILGIDFLNEKACRWDFGTGRANDRLLGTFASA